MKQKSFTYFVGDFETTVYEGQADTQVWAGAIVELYTEQVQIFHSIEETFSYLVSLNKNVCVYYHNLKFDGEFWLSFLMFDLQYSQAYVQRSENQNDIDFLFDKDMPNKSFKYSISDMGQWYSITIKIKDNIIQLRDSLKLLPFTVKKIGQSFGTQHKKLDMEYKGFRYAGCTITDEEQKYISNDVLVVKEALEIMKNEGHDKLTIGSCCLSEYQKTLGYFKYNELFPDLYKIKINPDIYGDSTAGDYIRRSYKGGWCYVVKGKENQLKHNGITADVNSLYPSMMSSESGNRYPIGEPVFWCGNFIPSVALEPDKYYFVRVKTRFNIKPNKLPCIQIKHNYCYPSNEWLESSDRINKKGRRQKYHVTVDDEIELCQVTLTLTMTDFKLISEHYYLDDFEILDGCWFYSKVGIFDEYIEKYKKIKLESSGAIRELAKLFLNNLYGKLASSPNSSFKLAYPKENKTVGYRTIEKFDKKPGYIACGSAITSYARNFTIRAAQKNYHGVNERGFIYADTDSIHCDLLPEELKGIKPHDKDFCCWKLEAQWDVAWFTRQKTYIEHVVSENLKPIENPYYNIKCAGMPETCKNLLKMSIEGYTEEEYHKLNPVEQEFVQTKRTIQDFKVGLTVPSKLVPKRIRGGVLLVETTYEMR